MQLAQRVLCSDRMHSITPCQRKISDRFPVASFVVNIPSNRLFEIVCTTDPQLLRPEYRGRRTTNNFFTSRSSGLLRAPAGHATYLVPADQLKRFAGQSRVYYALASYDSPRGDDLKLSVAPGAPAAVPSIQLTGDFTGRSLDRARIRGGARDGKYGGPTPVLTWGGDATAPAARDVAASYDDGFSPDLWTSAQPTTASPARGGGDDADPEIVYDEAGLGEAYGRPVRTGSSIVTSAEPAGFEDAAALRSAGATYGHVTPGGPAAAVELPGLEHVRDVAPTAYGRRGELAEPPGSEDARGGGRYGAAAIAATEPAGAEDARKPSSPIALTPAPAVATSELPGRGVDTAWADTDDEADLIAQPGDTGEALTIRRKFEILLPVAGYESGDKRYSAVLGNVDHHGLHWGLVLFTQRSGALGKVLNACERRDPSQFRQAFGAAHVDRLLQVTSASTPEARLAAVGNARLWAPDWMETFRIAGTIPAFQAAQNEIAIEHYFDCNLGFANALGLMSDRALAMIFDRTVHMGVGGARPWILKAVSPITDDAKRASALSALGHGDLTSFQRASGLEPTGRFGTQTHAAMIAALRALGQRAPFPVPALAEMLDKLVTAATAYSFAARVRGLRTATVYTDAVQRVV